MESKHMQQVTITTGWTVSDFNNERIAILEDDIQDLTNTISKFKDKIVKLKQEIEDDER